MEDEYYPWGSEFIPCSPKGCVAVVILNVDYTPSDKVAIYGSLKTENIGIEKIVANVISNPHIRYIVVCGDDIRGHRSGSSLVALNKNGIDEQNRIVDAPGAIPYIENINDKNEIDKLINECIAKSPRSFGAPYIAIRIKPEATTLLDDQRALHSKIVMDYMGKIKKRGE